MDGAALEILDLKTTDLDRIGKLKERLQRLLQEAANVEVELSRADGSIRGVPHYSVIEGRAHELGKQLSREVQRRQMGELTADHLAAVKCPACGTRCEAKTHSRPLRSVDGAGRVPEVKCHCPGCRRDFFPVA